jgi:hypothetical protein
MTEINYKLQYESLFIENNQLKDEIKILKEQFQTMSNHLKKYTAPTRHKKYYENHKEQIIEKVKEYQANKKQNITPKQTIISEKKKEYNKRAYDKRKLKNIT